MNLTITGLSPLSTTPGSLAAQTPNAVPVSSTVASPAATVEISAAARLASGSLPITQKIQPLNIIWGNGAK